MPALFVSPRLADDGAGAGLPALSCRRLGARIDAAFGRPRPSSPCRPTPRRVRRCCSRPRHEAVYDFGGFDPKLYELRYDAPGAPALAERVLALMGEAGLPVHLSPEGGLDHGNWTPLRYLYPEADVPVLPLAFVPTQTPGSSLRAKCSRRWPTKACWYSPAAASRTTCAVSSRAACAGRWMRRRSPSAAFRHWMAEQRRRATGTPCSLTASARRTRWTCTPPTSTCCPWCVAAGAGGRETRALRLHESVTYGCLGMDAYAFGPNAQRLLG